MTNGDVIINSVIMAGWTARYYDRRALGYPKDSLDELFDLLSFMGGICIWLICGFVVFIGVGVPVGLLVDKISSDRLADCQAANPYTWEDIYAGVSDEQYAVWSRHSSNCHAKYNSDGDGN